MKKRLFAIRDVKVEAFFAPMCQQNALEAQRTFQDLLADQRLEFHKHPGDYTLYEVGVFDSETGELTPSLPRVCLMGSDTEAIVPDGRQMQLPVVGER